MLRTHRRPIGAEVDRIVLWAMSVRGDSKAPTLRGRIPSYVGRGRSLPSSVPLLLVVVLVGVLAIAVPSTVATESSRVRQWALETLSLDAVTVDGVPVDAATASPDGRSARILVAGQASSGAEGLIVAVLDTDIAAGHQDLAGVLLPGYDFIEDRVFDPDAADRQLAEVDHGTMVASIIAAPDDGHGIRGVAPGVRILPVRIVPDAGQGTADDMAAGIHWALDNDADVINLSIRTTKDSLAVREAIERAAELGVPVVASAGLGPTMVPFYPAAYESVIAVAALTQSLEPYSGSPAMSYVDVAAPGFDIIAAGGSAVDVYHMGKGTSFAAPHVSGLIALMSQVAPDATATQLRQTLLDYAVDLGSPGRDDIFGVGLIDPGPTLAAIAPVGPPADVIGVRFGNTVWLNWLATAEIGRVSGYQVLLGDIVVLSVAAGESSVLAPGALPAPTVAYGVRTLGSDGRASAVSRVR